MQSDESKACPNAERALACVASSLIVRAKHDGLFRTLVGIHRGGAWVAERLYRELRLANPDSFTEPIGYLSSAYHRDDYGHNVQRRGLTAMLHGSTDLPFEVTGANIVLVDDVLYTGRTIRAALNELFDYGRPASVELAVLVDRGGRELPIQADFVGSSIDLGPNQAVLLAQSTEKALSFSLVER
ncbi:MAG: bifunctional pyr operon transcriptional regulator/uracil phosphoribosyltransferase PyrR [Betaproteobacteria bacterium]|nr:bifunctional pyr operon transcriptional regulator/uracil phosphoribosyltransferase PyrR [Betaproteobacteria bacterium]NDD11166.1 bifunctional pyr operon transcriptional regulator/uracil phosphoribosyltransferase PyrR [Betaproteobacteria bacterium]